MNIDLDDAYKFTDIDINYKFTYDNMIYNYCNILDDWYHVGLIAWVITC